MMGEKRERESEMYMTVPKIELRLASQSVSPLVFPNMPILFLVNRFVRLLYYTNRKKVRGI